MKTSTFTQSPQAFLLTQGEPGTPVAQICRQAGISQAPYVNWRQKHGALLPDEMRRLKALWTCTGFMLLRFLV